MADSKDKLRPGITETRGGGQSPFSSPVVLMFGIVLALLLFGAVTGKLEFNVKDLVKLKS